jgi:hypothetical protein
MCSASMCRRLLARSIPRKPRRRRLIARKASKPPSKPVFRRGGSWSATCPDCEQFPPSFPFFIKTKAELIAWQGCCLAGLLPVALPPSRQRNAILGRAFDLRIRKCPCSFGGCAPVFAVLNVADALNNPHETSKRMGSFLRRRGAAHGPPAHGKNHDLCGGSARDPTLWRSNANIRG